MVLKQIGPSVNSIITTGSVISKKGNTGGCGHLPKILKHDSCSSR